MIEKRKKKFNIFFFFFRKKRKKEQVIKIDNVKQKQKNNNKDEYIYPNVYQVPFFEEQKKKEEVKKDKEKDFEVFEEETINIIPSIPVVKEKEKTNISSSKKLDDIDIENAIISTLEKTLKKDYYELNNIKLELKAIEKKEKDEQTLEEINELLKQLQELIKKFERIKKDFYNKNYDKIDIVNLNDPYINDLISDYKDSIKNNNLGIIGLLPIKEIEEYIQIINNIILIENKSYNINNQVEDKKEELEIAEKELDKYESRYLSREKVATYIKNFSQEQDKIIKRIESLVEQKDNIIKTAEYKTEIVINYSKLMTSTLLMASAAIIPNTKVGNLIKIGLIAAAVTNMAKTVRVTTKEAKVTTKITSIDYSSDIKSSLTDINDMETMITNSLKDIKYMKQEFRKDFEQYKNIMPEYFEMITKLDSIEKELLVRKNLAETFENKLHKTL